MGFRKRGVFRALASASLPWLFCLPAVSGAATISFTLSSSTLSVASGGTATFSGTVANDSGFDLNASDFFLNFSGYDGSSVTPTQDLGVSTDFLIPDGTTSATVALFDVALGSVSPGSSFPIQVQLEDGNNDLSAVETVTVSVTGAESTPEPPGLWLGAAGMVCVLAMRNRRRAAGAAALLGLLAMPGAQSKAVAQTISTLTPTAAPSGSDFFVELPISNSGAATADDVKLTAVTWGSATLLSPALPVTLGNLSAGGSDLVTFTFHAASLTTGKKYLLSVRGTYQTATGLAAFALNRFVTAGVDSPEYTVSTLANSTPGGITFNKDGVAVDSLNNVFAAGAAPNSIGQGAFSEIFRLNGSGTTVVAGSTSEESPFPGCGDPATAMFMTDLGGVGVDSSDDVYIAQSGGGPVLRIAGGIANCMAGGQYFGAFGVVPDNAGNAYFSTSGASLVYKATAAGYSIVAGTGTIGCSGSQIGKPLGLALDSAGDLYIADQWCNAIWKVNASGKVVVAGSPVIAIPVIPAMAARRRAQRCRGRAGWQ